MQGAVIERQPFINHLIESAFRERERYVQGAVIERQPFINHLIESAFRATALSRVSDLVVGYQTDVLQVFPAVGDYPASPGSRELIGALLYRVKLSSPFSDLELIFSLKKLPQITDIVVLTPTHNRLPAKTRIPADVNARLRPVPA